MHPAYSVILFTTASGAGYGLLALLGLVGLAHGPVSNIWFGATAMVVGLGLVTLGLLSSTFHLGHPERAWRAFSQWQSSWLSREGIAAMATFLPALVFAASWIWSLGPDGVIALAGAALAVMAMVTVICTAMIYRSLPTIRQWNNPLVVAIYLAFSLATGAGLLLALAHFFGREQQAQVAIALVAILASGVLKILYWRSIDSEARTHTIEEATGLGHLGAVRQWEVPHTSANYINKEMGYRIARKHALKLRRIVLTALGLAAVLTLSLLSISGALATTIATLAITAAALATLVERWLFFAEAEHVVNLFYGTAKA